MANIAAAFERGLSWAVPATRQERAAALWSFGYFFALLAGYYVLRPLRDQMGIAGGVRNLPWLFTATFVRSSSRSRSTAHWWRSCRAHVSFRWSIISSSPILRS